MSSMPSSSSLNTPRSTNLMFPEGGEKFLPLSMSSLMRQSGQSQQSLSSLNLPPCRIPLQALMNPSLVIRVGMFGDTGHMFPVALRFNSTCPEPIRQLPCGLNVEIIVDVQFPGYLVANLHSLSLIDGDPSHHIGFPRQRRHLFDKLCSPG